jgi:hypothetical protein
MNQVAAQAGDVQATHQLFTTSSTEPVMISSREEPASPSSPMPGMN